MTGDEPRLSVNEWIGCRAPGGRISFMGYSWDRILSPAWSCDMHVAQLSWCSAFSTCLSCARTDVFFDVKYCRRHKRLEFNPRVWKIPWRRAWQPTSVFLPGESMDREAWWGTIHEVTKNQTWLSVWAHSTYARILEGRATVSHFFERWSQKWLQTFLNTEWSVKLRLIMVLILHTVPQN